MKKVILALFIATGTIQANNEIYLTSLVGQVLLLLNKMDQLISLELLMIEQDLQVILKPLPLLQPVLVMIF